MLKNGLDRCTGWSYPLLGEPRTFSLHGDSAPEGRAVGRSARCCRSFSWLRPLFRSWRAFQSRRGTSAAVKRDPTPNSPAARPLLIPSTLRKKGYSKLPRDEGLQNHQCSATSTSWMKTRYHPRCHHIARTFWTNTKCRPRFKARSSSRSTFTFCSPPSSSQPV